MRRTGRAARGPDVTTRDDVSSLAASIAIVSRTIARDARALGPYLEQERASDHAPDVAPRLEQVRDVLAGVASELQRARPDYLEQQRRALKLSPAEEPLKLHLGCGNSRLAGWVNIDYPPADLAMDLGWDLPFDDGSVTHAYMAHVLEHFDYPGEALALVKELHRVLAPRGVLRVVVPDIRKCIMAYAAGDGSFDRRADPWPASRRARRRSNTFCTMRGRRGRTCPGVTSRHDLETLSLLLTRGGFDEVGPSDT